MPYSHPFPPAASSHCRYKSLWHCSLLSPWLCLQPVNSDFQCGRYCFHLTRKNMHPFYALVHERNLRLAVNNTSVIHRSTETYFCCRRRKNSAFYGKNTARLFQCLLNITGNFRHRRNEQVAETVSCQITITCETILKQFFHHRLRISKRYQTITQISRRNDIELFTQSAGRTAIIRYRYNGCNIARYLLHTAQQNRKLE